MFRTKALTLEVSIMKNHEVSTKLFRKFNTKSMNYSLTWAIPAVKAKGLKILKIHSKDEGSCL